jgi:hypothetical protein
VNAAPRGFARSRHRQRGIYRLRQPAGTVFLEPILPMV